MTDLQADVKISHVNEVAQGLPMSKEIVMGINLLHVAEGLICHNHVPAGKAGAAIGHSGFQEHARQPGQANFQQADA